jgi:hypothetical protein
MVMVFAFSTHDVDISFNAPIVAQTTPQCIRRACRKHSGTTGFFLGSWKAPSGQCGYPTGYRLVGFDDCDHFVLG